MKKNTLVLLTMLTQAAAIVGLSEAYALPPIADPVSEVRQLIASPVTGVTSKSSWGWQCSTRDMEVESRDPITKKLRKIQLRYYGDFSQKPKTGAKLKLILPPTGGENFIDRYYARSLCARGAHAAILQNWQHQDEVSVDLNMHDRGILRAIAAVSHSLDYLQSLGFEKFEILGTSVGANLGAIMLGFDPRVERGVLIVGGADLPSMIAKSGEKTLAKLRSARNEKYAYTSEAEYEADLRKNLRYDIDFFLSGGMAKPVLIFMADQDVTVHTVNQERLAGYFSKVELKLLSGDHANVIGQVYWSHFGSIEAFLHRRN